MNSGSCYDVPNRYFGVWMVHYVSIGVRKANGWLMNDDRGVPTHIDNVPLVHW